MLHLFGLSISIKALVVCTLVAVVVIVALYFLGALVISFVFHKKRKLAPVTVMVSSAVSSLGQVQKDLDASLVQLNQELKDKDNELQQRNDELAAANDKLEKIKGIVTASKAKKGGWWVKCGWWISPVAVVIVLVVMKLLHWVS